MAPLVVDNEEKLTSLLTHITKRTHEGCLVFVDVEGVNLSRTGTVAVMQLLMPPEPIVYLVDVHLLGSRAFNMSTDTGINLKSVMESTTIFKVFFDIRNDSDALYAHFGIELAGSIDLQLLEYATRRPRGKFVNGLARCIEKDLPYISGWSATKVRGRRLFNPDEGGSYAVFLERPLQEEIVRYCEQDVLIMPRLLARYAPKVQPGIASQLQALVDERIRLSRSATFNGKGRHMALGPYIRPGFTNRDMDISPEISMIRSPQLRKLCQLDSTSIPDLVAGFEAIDLKPGLSTSIDDETSRTVHEIRASMAPKTLTAASSTPPQ